MTATLCLSLVTAAGLLAWPVFLAQQPLFAEIDLGDIAQGGQKQQAFQFRNDRGKLVDVAMIETSCPCASIHLEQTEIRAGEFLAGDVTLDLQSKPEFVGKLAIEVRGSDATGTGGIGAW